jgi:Bifunctional DNA primase/polymerase, N-terminal
MSGAIAPTIDHARHLALRGLPVFPCDDNKRPLVAGGFKSATTDATQITEWWTRWPDALIGVPTGDKFVVVDLDLQHDAAHEWLDAECLRLPLTRTHITRSGGQHLLFRPHAGVTCTTSKLGPHVDTRGTGGYIIWWPAAGFNVLHGREIAAVPDWIIDALKPTPLTVAPLVPRRSVGSSERCIDGLIRTIALAAEGERNAKTFWGACRFAELVRDGGISSDEAYSFIIEAAGRNGLPHCEAAQTARSAFKKLGVGK